MIDAFALSFSQARTFCVPLIASPSSSPVMRRLIEPLGAPPPERALPRRRKPRWPISCRRRRGHTACPRESPRRTDRCFQLVRRAARRRCDRRSRKAARRFRSGHKDCPPAPCQVPRRQAMAGKAERLQRAFQHVQRACVLRGDRGAADQRLGQGDGIEDRHGLGFNPQAGLWSIAQQISLIEVLARVFSSTRLTITAQ